MNSFKPQWVDALRKAVPITFFSFRAPVILNLHFKHFSGNYCLGFSACRWNGSALLGCEEYGTRTLYALLRRRKKSQGRAVINSKSALIGPRKNRTLNWAINETQQHCSHHTSNIHPFFTLWKLVFVPLYFQCTTPQNVFWLSWKYWETCQKETHWSNCFSSCLKSPQSRLEPSHHPEYLQA